MAEIATIKDIQCAIQQALAALVDVHLVNISAWDAFNHQYHLTLSNGTILHIDTLPFEAAINGGGGISIDTFVENGVYSRVGGQRRLIFTYNDGINTFDVDLEPLFASALSESLDARIIVDAAIVEALPNLGISHYERFNRGGVDYYLPMYTEGVATLVINFTSSSNEEGGNNTHTVALSDSLGGDFSFLINNGTASIGDYILPPVFSNGVTLSGNTITVPNGVQTFTVTISTVEDVFAEVDESYTLTMGGFTATGWINNDDLIQSFFGEAVQEGGILLFHATLGTAPLTSLAIPFSIGGGTAILNTDYLLPFSVSNGVAISGNNLIVPIGVTNIDISVQTIDNSIVDNTRTLIITIAGVSATGNIFDNDVLPPLATVLSVSSPAIAESGNLIFNIVLSGTTAQQETYAFSLAGTAIGGTDYATPLILNNGVTISGNNLIVPIGVSSFTASTITSDNIVIAADKTVVLTVGGVIGTGTIIENDIPAEPPLTAIFAIETPYYYLSPAQKSVVDGGTDGYVSLIASSDGLGNAARAYSADTANGTYTIGSLVNYMPSARIINTINKGITATAFIDDYKDWPASITAGTLGLIVYDGEHQFVRIDSYVIDTESKLEISMGALDTALKDVNHLLTEDARVYLIGSLNVSGTYANATTKYFKLAQEVTGTPPSAGLVADSTVMSVTFNQRAQRPYAPRTWQIGALYDYELNETTYEYFPFLSQGNRQTFTGSNRAETSIYTFSETSGSVEAGVTFRMRVYDEQGTLITTYDNITPPLNVNYWLNQQAGFIMHPVYELMSVNSAGLESYDPVAHGLEVPIGVTRVQSVTVDSTTNTTNGTAIFTITVNHLDTDVAVVLPYDFTGTALDNGHIGTHTFSSPLVEYVEDGIYIPSLTEINNGTALFIFTISVPFVGAVIGETLTLETYTTPYTVITNTVTIA